MACLRYLFRHLSPYVQSINTTTNVDQYDSISTWDFSTLYTTIPHSDLLVRVKKLIKLTFDKNEDCHLLVNGRQAYFSQSTRDGYLPFSCSGFCDLLEFLISNIYIKFGAELFRQIIGIPMGTNCAPLLANLYLFSYEYDFMMNLLKKKQLHLARKFNFSYRYIDDLISFNNPEFKKYYKKIYPKELELKETTENNFGCSYLDIYFFRDDRNMIKSKLYDKRDDFNFPIVNYPFLDSNIAKGPTYGVYISRLICFARACSYAEDFIIRHNRLIDKLLLQGFQKKILRRKFSNFFNKYSDVLDHLKIDLPKFLKDNIPLYPNG